MKKLIMLFFALLLSACVPVQATPEPGVLWVDPNQDLGAISPYIFGSNHGPWADFAPFSFEKATELGLTFLRWPGGNWGDQNDLRTYQIDNFILQARTLGAEPSITVRVPGSTPEKAAEIVRYTNIEKGYGVKYWNIGNEPSLYANNGGYAIEEPGGWTPAYYAKVWREFAVAMEAVDPTILFYGPDIHQFVGGETASRMEGSAGDYLVEFLKVNGDMVDVVTVHRYPFPTCNTCGNPTWDQLRENAAEWGEMLPGLRKIVQENAGKQLPVGVMEYNSNYSNVAGADTSPDSFYGALWLAEVFGQLVEDRPEMLAYFTTAYRSGHGLMTSFAVRPSYYVFSLWKRFGNHLLAASSDTHYVSVYAAKAVGDTTDDGAVTVMLINLNSEEVRKPLKLVDGDKLVLEEAYLFDISHNAEAVDLPAFENGGEILLPPESAMMLIFR
jgi:hypothetical protein